jgi:hypothetical protein
VSGSTDSTGPTTPGAPVGVRGSAASLAPVVARAVGVRPRLWLTALGAVWRLAEPGWWRRAPYLPLPDEHLWSFRMVTAYGRPDARPNAEDIVAYLEWCRTAKRRRFGS